MVNPSSSASGSPGRGENVEVLFTAPSAKIVSFTMQATGRSVSIGSASAISGGTESQGTLPWSTPTERTMAVGAIRIYRVPGSVSFLHSGSLLHAILPKSQCWCVDGKSVFVLRIRPNTYYRIEMPHETTDDSQRIEELRGALAEVLQYEKTPCPFKPGYTEDVPDTPHTPAKIRRSSTQRVKKWRKERGRVWAREDQENPLNDDKPPDHRRHTIGNPLDVSDGSVFSTSEEDDGSSVAESSTREQSPHVEAPPITPSRVEQLKAPFESISMEKRRSPQRSPLTDLESQKELFTTSDELLNNEESPEVDAPAVNTTGSSNHTGSGPVKDTVTPKDGQQEANTIHNTPIEESIAKSDSNTTSLEPQDTPIDSAKSTDSPAPMPVDPAAKAIIAEAQEAIEESSFAQQRDSEELTKNEEQTGSTDASVPPPDEHDDKPSIQDAPPNEQLESVSESKHSGAISPAESHERDDSEAVSSLENWTEASIANPNQGAPEPPVALGIQAPSTTPNEDKADPRHDSPTFPEDTKTWSLPSHENVQQIDYQDSQPMTAVRSTFDIDRNGIALPELLSHHSPEIQDDAASVVSTADSFYSLSEVQSNSASPPFTDAASFVEDGGDNDEWPNEIQNRQHKRGVSELTITPQGNRNLQPLSPGILSEDGRTASTPSTPTLISDSEDVPDVPPQDIDPPRDTIRLRRLGPSRQRDLSPLPPATTVFTPAPRISKRSLTISLVRKTYEILMSPPGDLVQLMLQIAARIAAGAATYGPFRIGRRQEILPGSWHSDEEDEDDWGEDDYGIPLKGLDSRGDSDP